VPLYPLQDFKVLYKYCIIIIIIMCESMVDIQSPTNHQSQLKYERVTYLASSARAQTAAASGALADVPVCLSVQRWCKSVVLWQQTT